jgi:hypothetical protein
MRLKPMIVSRVADRTVLIGQAPQLLKSTIVRSYERFFD